MRVYGHVLVTILLLIMVGGCSSVRRVDGHNANIRDDPTQDVDARPESEILRESARNLGNAFLLSVLLSGVSLAAYGGSDDESFLYLAGTMALSSTVALWLSIRTTTAAQEAAQRELEAQIASFAHDHGP